MAEQTKDTSSKSETGLVPWRQFLESCPPGKEVNVANMCRVEREIPSPNSPIRQVLITPEIELHCHSCNDKRFFIRASHLLLISQIFPHQLLPGYYFSLLLSIAVLRHYY